MISFTYPLVLILIPFASLLYFLIKTSTKNEALFSDDILEKIVDSSRFSTKKTKEIFIISSLIFSLVALSKPYIKGQELEIKSSSYELIVGFDISQSMKCDDLYPTRLEFAKNKFATLLRVIKEAKIAIVGFSSQAFLIAPTTSDYDSLRFLVKNLDTGFISLKGTSILSAMQAANDLYDKANKNKALLLFTDGGDEDNYNKEIEYAKQNNIKVYIYATATKKGGVIKDENGILKDSDGNIVVLKLNENIKKLAIKSGGAYLNNSYSKDDIKLLTDNISNSFKGDLIRSKKKIINSKELFYYPLLLSMLLLFLAIFSLPRRQL